MLFRSMAGRIPCSCGCGREVSYATKRNHLNARGTTALCARVGTETKSLKKDTRQQQKPTPLLQRGFKKRASSNPHQDGSRKRLKAAQLEENQLPETTASSQVDTNMMEDLLPPAATDTDRQSMFIERSRGVMEMGWATSRQDRGSHSNGSEHGQCHRRYSTSPAKVWTTSESHQCTSKGKGRLLAWKFDGKTCRLLSTYGYHR